MCERRGSVEWPDKKKKQDIVTLFPWSRTLCHYLLNSTLPSETKIWTNINTNVNYKKT